jgi:hypothetical protein
VPFNVPVESVVEPSLNVTVPVGMPVPDAGETFAVNVTLDPTATVTEEAVTVVEVAMTAVLTTRFTAPDAEEALLLSPLYTAVTAYVAAASEDVVKTALPLLPTGTAES